ncbi:MAG: hypothetical protein C0412_08530 [Flavobacterium sp.]|nr:hypothetical protein [Flavobacterium sp.]
MSRKIKFAPGEYYHIYNRGVDKRDIFMDKHDYERFLLLLNVCNSKLPIDVRRIDQDELCGGFASADDQSDKLVDIGVYCLMPNHFHILFREKNDNGISKFVQKLLTAYTMYFNNKYKRSGSLFQGVFQAKHANRDNYLKYLYSYIHLNPVKLIQSDWKEKGIKDIEKTKEFLKNYEYSSYLDYLGYGEGENKIVNKKAFPEYFESKENFKNNLFDWLKFRE